MATKGSPNVPRKTSKQNEIQGGGECQLCQKEIAVGKCRECDKKVGMTCAEMHPKIPVCATHVITYFTELVGDKKKRLEEFSKICHTEIAAAEATHATVQKMREKLDEKERVLRTNLEAAEMEALHKVKTHFAQQKEKLHIVVHSAKNTVDRNGDEADAYCKVTKRRLDHIQEILNNDKLLLNCDVEHHAIRKSGMSPVPENELINIFLKQDEIGPYNKHHVINLPVLHAFEDSRQHGGEGDEGDNHGTSAHALLSSMAKLKLKKILEAEIGQNARKIKIFRDKLWVLTEDGLQVSNNAGKLEKTVEVEAMKFAKSITITTEGDVVIVNRHGVVHYDMDSNTMANVGEGAFCDVTSVNEYVYALEHRKCELYIYKKNKNHKWTYKRSIALAFKSGHVKDTVTAKGESMCVGSYTKNTVYRYGIPNFDLIGQYNLTVGGVIRQPYVCCMDMAGTVLVSDGSSGKMVVIDRGGNIAEFCTDGLEIPTDAVMDEERFRLWVISSEMESWRLIGYSQG